MAHLNYSYTHMFRNEGISGKYREDPNNWWSKSHYVTCKVVKTVWYEICEYVKDHSGCTRSDIQNALSIIDTDLFTTMLWDGVIYKRRNGRTFNYFVTPRGIEYMNRAAARAPKELERLEYLNQHRIEKQQKFERREKVRQLKALKNQIEHEGENIF